VDDLVLEYQQTGNSQPLIDSYRNYILKYYKMFRYKIIDFDNYDIRRFLSCYIRSKDITRNLRRGPKYHKSETIAAAYRVLQRISRVFDGYELFDPPSDNEMPYDELFSELVMVFLECARDYKEQGVGFKRYLYKTYRYRLKKHIDSKLFDAGDAERGGYKDAFFSKKIVPFSEEIINRTEQPLPIRQELHADLNNENWFLGYGCGEPFKSMTYRQRRILVEYYECGYSDKEIARSIGLNPVYIGQIRRELVQRLRSMRLKGEIKWLR